MMEVSQGYFYQDGSCLVSDFCPLGSLLVNPFTFSRIYMEFFFYRPDITALVDWV